nr:HAD hydrolase-like protein [bacterium]
MKFDWILLDLDGTLTDSAEGIKKSVRHALNRMGWPQPAEERMDDWIGPPLRDSFMMFCGMSAQQAETAISLYRERFSTIGWMENRVYEGVVDMLAGLRQAGYCLALATAKPLVFAQKIIPYFGLEQYLSHINGADLSGAKQTKVSVMQAVLSSTGAKHPLMIGDREDDARASVELGVPCLGAGWGYAKPGELEAAGCIHIAEKPSDVLEWIRGEYK